MKNNKVKYFKSIHYRAILIVTTLIMLYACGSTRVYVKPDTKFNKKMSITITDTDEDIAGLRGELRYSLSSNGYNLISEAVAKEVTSLSLKGNLEENSINIDSRLYESIELKSVYSLNTKYRYIISPYSTRISNLQAELVDVFTGEVVMSISFKGNRSANGLAEKVVEEINKKVN